MSRTLRTYEEAVEFLKGRINYERIADDGYVADDLKLERMRQLLELLGNPHERISVIHVAGTKGKGSTSVMIAEILSAAGYKTALFTSPHVSAFEERMTVDGIRPTAAQLRDLVNRLIEPVAYMDRVSKQIGQTTYFELATALAWLYFLECGAQFSVLEVGLGGRLDATNICRPLVTVITNISRDHTNVLGSTMVQIAREKAGIIKSGVPLICGVAPGPAADAIDAVCQERMSPLYRLGEEIRWHPSRSPAARRLEPGSSAPPITIDVETPWGSSRDIPVALHGLHQGANAALAFAATAILKVRGHAVSPEAIHHGMAAVRWPARIEVVRQRPLVIIDAAHNWASTQALLRTLDADFAARRRILVFAATRDKDVRGMLRLLVPRFDSVILTQYHTNPRGVPVAELGQLVATTSLHCCHLAADSAAAWRLASQIAIPDDLICVTGSFFIATEMRDLALISSDNVNSSTIERAPAKRPDGPSPAREHR
jgi:dihydrofolate synthase/folylpolyglutamate synthase